MFKAFKRLRNGTSGLDKVLEWRRRRRSRRRRRRNASWKGFFWRVWRSFENP